MRSLKAPCKAVCSVQSFQGTSKASSLLLPIFLLAKAQLSDSFFKVREGFEMMDNTSTTFQKPGKHSRKKSMAASLRRVKRIYISSFWAFFSFSVLPPLISPPQSSELFWVNLMQSKLCSQMLGKFPTTPLQKHLCSDSQLFRASFVTDTCFPCGFTILLHTPTIRTCSPGSHTTKMSTEEDQITFQTVHALKTPYADLNLPSHEISPPPACHSVDSFQCCHTLCISSLELRHRLLLF